MTAVVGAVGVVCVMLEVVHVQADDDVAVEQSLASTDFVVAVEVVDVVDVVAAAVEQLLASPHFVVVVAVVDVVDVVVAAVVVVVALAVEQLLASTHFVVAVAVVEIVDVVVVDVAAVVGLAVELESLQMTAESASEVVVVVVPALKMVVGAYRIALLFLMVEVADGVVVIVDLYCSSSIRWDCVVADAAEERQVDLEAF